MTLILITANLPEQIILTPSDVFNIASNPRINVVVQRVRVSCFDRS